MASASPFSKRVLAKALPALLLALFIFVTLMVVMNYTQAVFLVVLLWIILPVLAVQTYRKMKRWLKKEN